MHSLQNVTVGATKAAKFLCWSCVTLCFHQRSWATSVQIGTTLSPTQGRRINFETMTCMRGTRECHFSLTVCGKVCMEGFISLRITSLKEACSHPPKFLMGHIHHHWILVRLALLQVLSQCLPVILYVYTAKVSEPCGFCHPAVKIRRVLDYNIASVGIIIDNNNCIKPRKCIIWIRLQ